MKTKYFILVEVPYLTLNETEPHVVVGDMKEIIVRPNKDYAHHYQGGSVSVHNLDKLIEVHGNEVQ